MKKGNIMTINDNIRFSLMLFGKENALNNNDVTLFIFSMLKTNASQSIIFPLGSDISFLHT